LGAGDEPLPRGSLLAPAAAAAAAGGAAFALFFETDVAFLFKSRLDIARRNPAKAQGHLRLIWARMAMKNGAAEAYMCGFLARIFHFARAAGSAARRRLKTTAPYNVNSAVEFAWEHERSSSSHDTTALLSPQLL